MIQTVSFRNVLPRESLGVFEISTRMRELPLRSCVLLGGNTIVKPEWTQPLVFPGIQSLIEIVMALQFTGFTKQFDERNCSSEQFGFSNYDVRV